MDPSFAFDDGGFVAKPAWTIPNVQRALSEEHAERRTTPLKHKINQQLQAREKLAKRREQWKVRELAEAERKEEEAEDEWAKLRAGKWGDDEGEKKDNRKRRRKAFEEETQADAEVEESNAENVKLEESGEGISDDDSDSEEETEKGAEVLQKKPPRVQVEFPESINQNPATYFSSSKQATFSAKSFLDLSLSRPLVRACQTLGYQKPTPIQAACIPLAMAGRDICGSAITGSGKTAAFALPTLERLLRQRNTSEIEALVLTPTRELAVQVHSMMQNLAQFTDIQACLVVGGLSAKSQEAELRRRPSIVIATPGRILDHLSNSVGIGLESLSILILDEADRLLDMGFEAEVNEIVRLSPKDRQTMLFSATLTSQVSRLAQLSLKSPVRLQADPTSHRPKGLTEEVVRLKSGSEEEKEAIVLALCLRTFKSKTIVFRAMKAAAHRLRIIFGLANLNVGELHGNLTQSMRLAALEEFRNGDTNVLIATDVAARGLDISGVETVISTECPRDINTYVHRVGRTARAGGKGFAVTFVEEKDRKLLKSLACQAGRTLKVRSVPEAITSSCQKMIGEMELDILEIMREEKAERELRKAEMEANKAQNLVEHEAEIFSRPKKVWFQSSKEKKALEAADKVMKTGPPEKKMITLEEKEEEKRKQQLKKDRERNMTRRQRRKLEAQREDAMEDEEMAESDQVPTNEKQGKNLADLAYRRAKASKAQDKLRAAGKIVKLPGKAGAKKSPKKAKKSEEQKAAPMQKQPSASLSSEKKGRKPGVSRKSFKSKARFKRRK